MNERQRKLEAIKANLFDLLYITKPIKACAGHGDVWEKAAQAQVPEIAEQMLKDIEQVEREYEFAR